MPAVHLWVLGVLVVGWVDDRALLLVQKEQALGTGMGSLSQEGTLKAKPSRQRRGQSLPAYTFCKWQHCHFPAVSCGVFAH